MHSHTTQFKDGKKNSQRIRKLTQILEGTQTAFVSILTSSTASQPLIWYLTRTWLLLANSKGVNLQSDLDPLQQARKVLWVENQDQQG